MTNNTHLKTICFIAPKAYALFNSEVKHNFGGAEVDLYYLAVEFAKDPDYSISFITADYGGNHIEKIDGVRIIKTFDFKDYIFRGMIKFWKGLNEANAECYFIKTISPGMFITAFFCFIKRRNFIYRSAHTHNCDGTYIKKHKIYGKLYKWALLTNHLIFVQNRSDKQQLLQTTGRSSIAIPNGHPIPILKQQKRDIILWVGRSAIIKQPELFIELASHFPNEKFVMICIQATGDRNYHRLIKKAKNIKNIEFIDYMEFKCIQPYFNQAKIFVNTSRAEGFPNTFIQAFISATPVLSYQVSPDNLLTNQKMGFCCEGIKKQLSEKLQRLLSEEKTVSSMGKSCRNYVKQTHDIKKIVKIYKELIFENFAKSNARV